MRITEPGLVCHVLNRRVMRLPLFLKDEDYLAFERVLAPENHPDTFSGPADIVGADSEGVQEQIIGPIRAVGDGRGQARPTRGPTRCVRDTPVYVLGAMTSRAKPG